MLRFVHCFLRDDWTKYNSFNKKPIKSITAEECCLSPCGQGWGGGLSGTDPGGGDCLSPKKVWGVTTFMKILTLSPGLPPNLDLLSRMCWPRLVGLVWYVLLAL